MAGVKPTAIAIEMRLDGSNWTDVSDDVIGPIKFSYGIRANGVPDRVASTGRMTFRLNNGELNSAQTLGYYSPGHADCRTGFDAGILVRLRITYDSRTKTKFYGHIPPDGIDIITGKHGGRYVDVTVLDYMDLCARHEILLPELTTDKTMDEVLPLLTAMLPREPVSTDYAEGVSTFPYVFDMVRSKTYVLSEMNKLALSEIGYIFPRHDWTYDEVLVCQSRYTRGAALTVKQVNLDLASLGFRLLEDGSYRLQEDGTSKVIVDELTDADFDESFSAMDVSRGRHVHNSVLGKVYPRKVDTSAVTLWQQQTELQLKAGETKTLRYTYRDPSGAATRVGGTDMVDPAVTTDYTMFTATGGGGSNISADLAVVCTFGAYDVSVQLTNNNAAKGYINLLKGRGKGVYTYDPVEYLKQDATSIAAYGTQALGIDMKYEQDPLLLTAFIDLVVSRHKDPANHVQGVAFNANRADGLMQAFMAVEPGDRVHLTESVSAIDDDFFVNGMEGEILPGGIVRCSWFVNKAALEVTGTVYFSQPDGTDGIDTYLNSNAATTNYGNEVYMKVFAGTASGLIKFDLSTIPATALILNAKLYLYSTADYGIAAAEDLSIYRLKRAWVEGQATWNIFSTGNNWQTAGANGANDYDNNSLSDIVVPSFNSTWCCFDLDTDLFQELIDGTMTNNGFKISTLASLVFIRTSDYLGDPSLRPYLQVSYLT